MKIVKYSGNEAKRIFENISTPVIDGSNIEWEGGSLKGIKLPFLVLDDSVNLKEGDAVTADHIAQDQKHLFQKRDLEKENTDLKKQLADLSFELMMKGVL